MMNLVIVESPAKGQTIERYLGKDFKVLASFGHIRDLPITQLGVDIENHYEPHYLITPRARKTVNLLKNAASKADNVYLATDYDREGEAIAWHVVQAIGLGNSKFEIRNSKRVKRITFHEITKQAIEEAVKYPREIDMDLVDAQQARRVLDRLVGYKLSPFLWKKVAKGLSAGRVQSVAVRLIVDREREIADFKPQEYWTVIATLSPKSKSNPPSANRRSRQNFDALLIGKNGKKIEKLEIKNQKEADQIIKNLEKAEYIVKDILSEEKRKWPFPPFTTSTLQQEASHRLGFSAKQTMKLAQDLYEAGFITYMRTDSTNLSTLAVNGARKFIEKEYGRKYLPEKTRIYKTKSRGAQEAHEAIRTTHVQQQTISDKGSGKFNNEHLKLYDLIWRRTVACQMNEAVLDSIKVDIKAKEYTFRANGQMIKFDGFLKVYPVKIEEINLPKLEKGDHLKLIDLLGQQHFTEPPARYTEASLVKALEEHGIGRPSTYAPIISTIQDRGYVRLEQRKFYPNETGFLVTDLLKDNFSDIVDVGFTANMEEELDKIAEGKLEWTKSVDKFYQPFSKNLDQKYKEVKKEVIINQDEAKGERCEKCGKPMMVRMGRYGKFLSCSGFPECRNAKPIIKSTGVKCPECGVGEIIELRTKKGKIFWGCSKYPECKYASWEEPKIDNAS